MSKFTPAPLEATLGHDGRHHTVPILAKGPQFVQDGNEPYHPLIGVVYHGRGHAPREIAEMTAVLFAASPIILDLAQRLYNRLDLEIGHRRRLEGGSLTTDETNLLIEAREIFSKLGVTP